MYVKKNLILVPDFGGFIPSLMVPLCWVGKATCQKGKGKTGQLAYLLEVWKQEDQKTKRMMSQHAFQKPIPII